MSTSSVLAVKAGLVTTIKAQSVCADPVLVTYDPPSEYQPDDVIVVGKVDRNVAPATIAGGLAQQGTVMEDYLVEVTVSCFRGGDEAQTTFERACTLADAVESAVRADTTLGGHVFTSWPHQVRYDPADWTADHKGRLAEAQMLIYAQMLI